MVIYEIRKLFQKRLTILIFLLLFLGNGLFAFNHDAPSADYGFGAVEIRSVYAALPQDRSMILPALDAQLEVLNEAVWSDDYEGQVLTKDVYNDLILLRRVRNRCEIVLNYDAYLASVEENALALQHSGIYDDTNSFGYRNIQKSAEVYSELRGTEPQVFYSATMEGFSNSRLSDIALVLISLLLAFELIYSERKQETMALIKPTVKGRVALIRTKLITASLVLMLSLLIIYGSNYIIGIYRFGMIPLGAPIQSIYGFEGSALSISIGEYLLRFIGMKYLWLLGICFLLMLVFIASKNLMQMIAVLCLFSIPSLLCLQSTGVFAYFNLIGAGNTEELFRIYRNLNLFGFPVSTLAAALMYILVSLIFSVVSILLLHCRCSPALSFGGQKSMFTKPRVILSIFRHESYKFWISGGALILLLLLLGLQVYQSWKFNERLFLADQMYLNYCRHVEGEPNSSKEAYLEAEQKRFDDLRKQIEHYDMMLQEGSLDVEGHQMLCYSIRQQLDTEEIFQRVVVQYRQAKQQNSHIVCHLSYDRLTGKEGREDLLLRGLMLTIVLILGISRIEASEHETNMDQLIHSTVGEKKSRRTKGLILLVFTILCVTVSFLPYLLIIHRTYHFTGFSSPANAVPQLCISIGTVGSALLFYASGILLSSLAAGAWIRFLSRKTGRTVTTMMLSAATLLVPVAALWLLQIL